MAISLVVNAIVSALMISRIMYVRTKTAPQDRAHSKLSWVAAVLLESAIFLFVAQLVYLVLYKLGHAAFGLVAGPVTIIYVSSAALDFNFLCCKGWRLICL